MTPFNGFGAIVDGRLLDTQGGYKGLYGTGETT